MFLKKCPKRNHLLELVEMLYKTFLTYLQCSMYFISFLVFRSFSKYTYFIILLVHCSLYNYTYEAPERYNEGGEGQGVRKGHGYE